MRISHHYHIWVVPAIGEYCLADSWATLAEARTGLRHIRDRITGTCMDFTYHGHVNDGRLQFDELGIQLEIRWCGEVTRLVRKEVEVMLCTQG